MAPSSIPANLGTLTYRAGDTIFAQGDPADSAFILESGRIAVLQRFDGTVFELDSIGPGEMFGEMVLLSGSRHMVTAIAAEDSVVAPVPPSSYEGDLRKAGRAIRAVIATFVKNIQCSHRIFLRRPRSLRDHLRQMSIFADNIRRFSAKVQKEEVSARMIEEVRRIEAGLAQLSALIPATLDPRHDMIVDENELYGVSFRDVASSATLRRVISQEAARP